MPKSYLPEFRRRAVEPPATLQLPMWIWASAGGVYAMVGIAGYIASALIVVGVFVVHRLRREAKLAQLDEEKLSPDRGER